MIKHNYNGIYRRTQGDGIVLSLTFASPSMASLTADFFLIYIHVSEKNKAAQGRYHHPDMVVVIVNGGYLVFVVVNSGMALLRPARETSERKQRPG